MILGRHFNELAAEHKLKDICRVGNHQTQLNQMPRRASWRLSEPNWMSMHKYDTGTRSLFNKPLLEREPWHSYDKGAGDGHYVQLAQHVHHTMNHISE